MCIITLIHIWRHVNRASPFKPVREPSQYAVGRLGSDHFTLYYGVFDMRSLAYLGIALSALCVGAAAPADESTPNTDSLAKMPANPVTSAPTETKDAAATPVTADGKQPGHSETSSTVPPGGTPSPAPTSGTAAAGDAAAQPPAQPKKVCRTMDVPGSKIPKRVCATQDEWQTFNNNARQDAQDGLRRAADHGAVAPAGISTAGLP